MFHSKTLKLFYFKSTTNRHQYNVLLKTNKIVVSICVSTFKWKSKSDEHFAKFTKLFLSFSRENVSRLLKLLVSHTRLEMNLINFNVRVN